MHLHCISHWVEQWPGLHVLWHQSLLSEDMQGKTLVFSAHVFVRRTIGLWREGGGEGLQVQLSLSLSHTHIHTHTHTLLFTLCRLEGIRQDLVCL